MDQTPQRGAGLFTPVRRGKPACNDNDSGDVVDDDEDVELVSVCVVGESLKNNAALMADVHSFKLKVVFSRCLSYKKLQIFAHFTFLLLLFNKVL
jgi:hypothetical protein